MLSVAIVADTLLSCLYVVDQETGCFALIRFIFWGPFVFTSLYFVLSIRNDEIVIVQLVRECVKVLVEK